jgi:PIN domain nuclease of toxin-antitoxin system
VEILLDTNVFLWCIAGEIRRLSRPARKAVASDANELLLSVASLWEICLKAEAGKLDLPRRRQFFREHLSALGVRTVLPVEVQHVFGMFDLPPHHRDPFDRLLISQCRTERIPIVTPDRAIRLYHVDVIW